jgi:hypothetical protein
MIKFRYLAAVAALALSTPVLAVNLAVNGSFETGDFTGWTQFGDTSFTTVEFGSFNELPTDGNWQAVFGPTGGIGGIRQSFASAGTYNVSFDLANTSGSFSSVDFGGINLLSNVGDSTYTSYLFNVTVGANSTLSFSFQNTPDYYSLDNVVVELASGTVPEPDTWAMLIAGFGLTGAAMRRRRRAASLA